MFKVFKTADPTDYDAAKRMYLEQLEAQAVAASMVMGYNRHIQAAGAQALARGSVAVAKATLVEIVHDMPGQVRGWIKQQRSEGLQVRRCSRGCGATVLPLLEHCGSWHQR